MLRPARSTRTDPLFPYTTLVLSYMLRLTTAIDRKIMGAQRRDAGRDAVHANAAIGIDVRQDHPRTVLPERLRGSGADAVHRCCHERNFPIEPANHVLSN